MCGSQVFAQQTAVCFEGGTLESAKAKAAQEKKVLFIMCTANYCGACRMMEREVFTVPEVADFYNKNFVSYKLNMDNPDGKAFGKTCEVPAYPTLIFMDEQGDILFKNVGGLKTKEFMELSRRACAREKSESVRFEEGDRDKDFVLGYLKRLGDRSLDLELQAAFNTLYEEEGSKLLKDKDYWEIFKKYVSNRDCPAAVDFLKNYKRYAKQYGEGATFWKVRNLYANFTCVNTLYETDKYGFPNYKKGVMPEKKEQYFALLDERELPHAEELKAQINLMCLLNERRYDEAFALGEKHLAEADAGTLCAWAALADRLTRDEAARKKMAAWADRALESASDAACREEAQEMGKRLKTQDYPVLEKRGETYSLPI